MSQLRVSFVQLTSKADWQANLSKVMEMMLSALKDNPRLIVLPENVFLFDAKQMRAIAEGTETELIFEQLKKFAKQHSVFILIGSHPSADRLDGQPVADGRVRQSLYVISDQGLVVQRYDKIHLFDVTVADKAATYQESKFIEPGELEPKYIDIDGVRVGLSICYDLRFPELYRALNQLDVDMIVVPSAFTYRTGNAHWHALLCARAIENQVYMLGVDQVGWHNETRQTYGNSVAYSPWGDMLVSLDDKNEGVASFTVDQEYRQSLEQAMPCKKHRRFEQLGLQKA